MNTPAFVNMAGNVDAGKNKGKAVDRKASKNKVGRPRETANDVSNFILASYDGYEKIRAGIKGDDLAASTAEHMNKVANACIMKFGWVDPLKLVKEEADSGEKEAGGGDDGEEGGDDDGEEGGGKGGLNVDAVEAAVSAAKKMLSKKGGAGATADELLEAKRKDGVSIQVRAVRPLSVLPARWV